MSRPVLLVESARAKRANHKSIRQIARELGVPRSTVGGWLRGVGDSVFIVEACELCGEPGIRGNSQARFCSESHRMKATRLKG